MRTPPHIFIIGMMGCGKSSIAPLLSKKLKIPYIDIDKDLISILNTDIEKMFNTLTEKKFRLLESTYFLEHIKQNQCIYATGGGIILNKTNREVLCSTNHITILLQATIDTLYQHIIEDRSNLRPLHMNSPNKKRLQAIWDERKKYYFECANIIIKTENKSLNTIVNQIINSLKV